MLKLAGHHINKHNMVTQLMKPVTTALTQIPHLMMDKKYLMLLTSAECQSQKLLQQSSLPIVEQREFGEDLLINLSESFVEHFED